VSRRGGGRPAPLPPTGYRPTPRLAVDSTVVRFVAEDADRATAEFDFTTLPVAARLGSAFAQAFAARVGPGGSVRTLGTAQQSFNMLRGFANYLASLNRPPAAAADLRAAHLRGWALQRPNPARELATLKANLRAIQGLSAEFVACLAERNPPRRRTPLASYSREEFGRIVAAARYDVRRTADRIRSNRQVLERWRAGEFDDVPREMRERGQLLDYVERHVDVPRTGPDLTTHAWARRLGGLMYHVTALHLSTRDAAAFVVLLVALTGQNPSTIINAPAAHHRADGYSGGPATAVIELDKPRRGRLRHMDVALVDLPQWVPTPAAGEYDDDERIDLRSPFGVYMLLHELAAPARAFLRSDKLLVWWGKGIGVQTGLDHGHVAAWAKRHSLPGGTAAADDDRSPGNRVTLLRLRLTFAQLHQRPVAHTEQTLANDYLARDRGNIEQYQQVVADSLVREVAKATTRERIRSLSPAEVAEAAQHPARVAARHGMDAQVLRAGCLGTTSQRE
jgi:hypothetical protein